jgi:transcriptional regulator with XRE-family HTH domain
LEPLASEVGQALRRVRQDTGMTLQGVAEASGGRFKATSVAGYERGERSITVERFCDLCQFYGVEPGQLLIDIVRALEHRAEPMIDLAALESLQPEKGVLVSSFVRQIRALRREQGEEAVVIRTGDLEILAKASGVDPEELLELLRPSRRSDD